MSEIKQPPQHPFIYVAGGIVYVSEDGMNATTLTPDQAVLVGLVLMETGLYLKQLAKEK